MSALVGGSDAIQYVMTVGFSKYILISLFIIIYLRDIAIVL